MEQGICMACGNTAREGLRIGAGFLCGRCERSLIRSNAGKLDYEHWIATCRKLWESLKINIDE